VQGAFSRYDFTNIILLYKVFRRVLLMQFSPSSSAWTSAFAWQSALFALATIRPLDELLNASRPYRRSPLKGNPRRLRSRGQLNAIDASVTIAIPSLRSLQHSHNKYRSLIMPLHFVCLLRNNTAQSLVLFVKLGVRYDRRLAAPRSKLTNSVYKYAPNKVLFRVWVSHPI